MVAAYTYGFPVAEKAFKDAKVPLVTLTNYEAVMEVALRTGYIEEEDVETLNEWRKDPAHWESGKLELICKNVNMDKRAIRIDSVRIVLFSF